MRARLLIAAALVLHVVLQLGPALDRVQRSPNGRDYASYHYAVHVAADGGDPYDKAALGRAAQAEGTRKTVHPYFYPPPFLLAMAWALPLTLKQGALAMLLLNEALLAACLVLLRRAYAAPLEAIALVLAAYTPIPDNAWMGQANLMALLPALAGLALAPRRPVAGGVLVGVAGMFKMSPALFLGYWILRGNWRAAASAAVTAVALSVAALPLVPLPVQLGFYTEVLPGFFAGDYHGLTVPVVMNANHSIPELFARLWPAPSPTALSADARHAGTAVNLALLGLWAWCFRRAPSRPGVASDGPAIAALTILMVVSPAYAYEHHLVFLLPSALVAAGVLPVALFLPLFALMAWPLSWLDPASRAVPSLARVFQELKFVAALGFFAALLWSASRHGRAPDETPS
jgi:alpha-1,2-mannosyltransferase